MKKHFICWAILVSLSYSLGWALQIEYKNHSGKLTQKETAPVREEKGIANIVKRIGSLIPAGKVVVDDYGINVVVENGNVLSNFRRRERVQRKYRVFSTVKNDSFSDKDSPANSAWAVFRILDLYAAKTLRKKTGSDTEALKKAKDAYMLPASNSVAEKLKKIMATKDPGNLCISIDAEKLMLVNVEVNGKEASVPKMKYLWLVFDIETADCGY